MRHHRSRNLAPAVALTVFAVFAVVAVVATWAVSGASAALGEGAPLPHLVPLPAELDRRMDELLHTAEKYRGLRLIRPVPRGTLEPAEVQRLIEDDLQHELPPGQLAAFEEGLRAFGLIPDDLKLADYYPKLLTSQVAGFYDPHHKYLALVGQGGKPLSMGPGDSRLEDTVVIHELTHAIQDQHFDLEKLDGEGTPLEDATSARAALVEGDATLTMIDGLSGNQVENQPELARGIQQMLDPAQILTSQASAPGVRELAAAPAWFRESLIFSYANGLGFCLSVRQKGGQALLDAAFSTDPPRSTEQILHPEKWHTRRDDPVQIAWPDLARQLPGWRQVSAGTFGEEGIRILLLTRKLARARAAAAAGGWGGDRFVVYARGTARLAAWITDWDEAAGADRFQAAAAELGAGWHLQRAGARRVTLWHGPLGAAEGTALATALASARAEVPPPPPAQKTPAPPTPPPAPR